MQLTNRELYELAEFFAKRFPESCHRTRFAREIRMFFLENDQSSPDVAWQAFLSKAQDQDRLYRLAHISSLELPDDEILQGVCELLGGNQRRLVDMPLGIAAVAGLLCMALTGGVGAAWLITTDDASAGDAVASKMTGADMDAAASEGEVPATEPLASNNSDSLVSFLAPSNLTPAPSVLAEEPGPAELPVIEETATPTWVAVSPSPTVATVSEAPPRQLVDLAHHHGKCTLPEDGIVGYWYAGSDLPAATGDIITMGHSVNVRADYPDVHNGFDKRTAIRCVLMDGDQVRIRAEAVLVPGNRYWIPLHSGDVILAG